jgi:K+-sensing histidine kinase KdpD
MSFLKEKALTIANLLFWFILLYIVAMIVYWFIALQQQSRQITTHRKIELKSADPGYRGKIDEINNEERRKTLQYIGEGATFLLLIIVGAVFIYRAVRRQFIVSQQQHNFMMAITHELKTPISITKLNLETLQKHKLDEEKQHKLIQMTLQETERLNSLADNILISSQLEGGGYKMSKEELDLSSLASACVQDYSHRFTQRKWISKIENDIVFTGDALLLQIMINNLLENAIKYSPKDSTISFDLNTKPGSIELNVADEGNGIPENEKKNIFERFYRIGNEDQRKTKGTGLGLYLCRKIAKDHHANIFVSNNITKGSIFTIRFIT